MKKLVVFTGAGVSAESGLRTFRDSNGLWEEYDVMEVATPEAWHKNPGQVLRFYNMRRKQAIEAQPNAAHHAIVHLEKKYDVHVITQNIDDLHERAGSSKVLHLHGEINKARSTEHPELIYELDHREMKLGDTCEKGAQLRPHIVWFGEAVPNMEIAYDIVSGADIMLIIGTSLNVYPAAGLIHYAPLQAKKYLVDPKAVNVNDVKNITVLKEKASTGVEKITEELLEEL
ncbi:MAG: NAD-dependent protein deacylase [Flavobacteriales bacterium]|nr:NAD-dependent deacylase [Bacteroidales bacterium AH-315-I05]PCJ86774.1 MAG: NAD-dependent protein deacylase [Flavobacteriales bacterium]